MYLYNLDWSLFCRFGARGGIK